MGAIIAKQWRVYQIFRYYYVDNNYIDSLLIMTCWYIYTTKESSLWDEKKSWYSRLAIDDDCARTTFCRSSTFMHTYSARGDCCQLSCDFDSKSRAILYHYGSKLIWHYCIQTALID